MRIDSAVALLNSPNVLAIASARCARALKKPLTGVLPVVVKISNDLVRPDYSPLMQTLYGVWLRIQGGLLDRFVALSEPMLPQIVAGLAIAPERARAILGARG